MTRAEHLLDLCEGQFKNLMKNKVPLDPEERAEVMKRKAVWHFHSSGATPAIWKSSDSKGKPVYGCNTHRCMNTARTLKGAIARFPFIKGTA